MQAERHGSPDLVNLVEAVLFASGNPITMRELRRIFERYWASEPAERRDELLQDLKPAVAQLEERWAATGNARGFAFVRVADGIGFRSNPRYSALMRALRDERPQRLSKPALETLAIVAYRQPVTKPEVDHIRGVDCSGTVRMLLERSLIRIVGKKEEPGRPLLYGTTREFLSFFSLASLSALPSLRDVNELGEEAKEELRAFDGLPSLQELSDSAKQLRIGEEPAVVVLDNAVQHLESTANDARAALASEGIALDPEAPESAKEKVHRSAG